MTPIDTNHDSLSIHFDFLEESGNETEELRIDLISPNSFHWCYEYKRDSVGIGIYGIDVVGFVGDGFSFDSADVGNNFGTVGDDCIEVGNFS